MGFAMERAQLTIITLGFECFHAPLDVGLSVGQHGVDQACQLMGSGLDCFGGIHSRQACAMGGADEGVAASGVGGCLANGLAGTVEDFWLSPG